MNRSQEISRLLGEAFPYAKVEVVNESASHKGHGGHDGSGETHFCVVVEDDELAKLPQVQSHRRVYAALKELFQKGLHALRVEVRSSSR